MNAVDLSPVAVAWAQDRAREAGADVRFHCGGHLALTCFVSGEMGSELPDAAFYQQSRLHEGLAHTPESLRWIFSDLTEVELRRMHDEPPGSPLFGKPFLWTALFRRIG